MAYQDFKDRAVTWIIFPAMAIILCILHLHHSNWESVVLFSLINSLLVTSVLLILFLYSKLILKKKFLDVSLGTGDILFFYALALGFPTFTFVLLFVGAIFFSLTAFIIYRSNRQVDTVPLAGLMGMFLICVFLANLFPMTPSLYTI